MRTFQFTQKRRKTNVSVDDGRASRHLVPKLMLMEDRRSKLKIVPSQVVNIYSRFVP